MAQKCKGEHKYHMCELAKDEKFLQIKLLMISPQYICHDCGRAANSDDNLCKPANVDAIGLYER